MKQQRLLSPAETALCVSMYLLSQCVHAAVNMELSGKEKWIAGECNRHLLIDPYLSKLRGFLDAGADNHITLGRTQQLIMTSIRRDDHKEYSDREKLAIFARLFVDMYAECNIHIKAYFCQAYPRIKHLLKIQDTDEDLTVLKEKFIAIATEITSRVEESDNINTGY